MISLRQRIRYDKICCMPWKRYKRRIRGLPISAQCLFSKEGIPYDILEIELIEEGWLLVYEKLWNILSVNDNLKRGHFSNGWEAFQETEETPFDKDWIEEDYVNFYKIQ